ncbi:t-SNARE [Cyathus striatus]|nr:t-SNARE [Cyathus striatus]
MAHPTDRLAAARAQRAQQFEMNTIDNQSPHMNGHSSSLNAPSFLQEIDALQDQIRLLNTNIDQISTLHSQQLNTIDSGGQTNDTALDSLASDTQTLAQAIKNKIRDLNDLPPDQNAAMRRNQLNLLRSQFADALRKYQRVEQENRAKLRERAERQFKIVKPDATPEEVREVVEGGGHQVFAQALLSSTRYGESRVAYREVQERQVELQRMEKTLAELAQLFTDMGTLVEQQDVVINNVENTAIEVETDMRKGLEHTETAVKHARSARKKRWICFFICIFVAVVLAVVLGVVFGRK